MTTGRPEVLPVLLFRLILLKIACRLSDRDLIKWLRTDMEYKYFAGYAPEDIKLTTSKNIKLAAKLSECVTHGNRRGKEFEYNKDSKMYVCPAGLEATLKVKLRSNKAADTHVKCFYFDVEKCKVCPLVQRP